MSIEISKVTKVLKVNMSREYHSWNAILNADLPDFLVDAIYSRIMEKLTDREILQEVNSKRKRRESCYEEREDEEEIATQPPKGKRRKTTDTEVSDDIKSLFRAKPG